MSPLFSLYSFLFGLIVGSFLNVCIYRLPRGKSIVVPRSSCPGCGKFISWYDNIPLFSYLLLRGRCRSCQKPISARYPLVELITGFFSLFVYWKFGAEWAYLLYFLFLVAPLVAITFIDLEHLIIPDVISLPGIVAGVVVTIVLSSLGKIPTAIFSLTGLLVGGGTLFLVSWLYEKLRHQEGIGGGDIKLAAIGKLPRGFL